jgi:hypothetical protein
MKQAKLKKTCRNFLKRKKNEIPNPYPIVPADSPASRTGES